MRKPALVLALAFLPLLYPGEEKVILNPTDRGDLPNVPVSPDDHSGDGIEYHPPFANGGASSLLTNLVSYWNLNEISGTRAQTAGDCSSCDLTAVNAPGAGGGAGKYAMLSESTKAAYSSNAALGAVNTSFTAAVWAEFTGTLGVFRIPMGSDTSSNPNRDWVVYYDAAGAGILTCFDSAAGSVNANGPNAISVGRRVLITAVYDQSTKKCQLYHDSTGGALSSALTTGIKNAYTPFVVGDRTSAGSTSAWQGPIGPAYYWSGKAFSGAEVAALYNSTGYACSDLTASLKTSLTACWDLNEASGTRAASSVGSCGTPACDMTVVNAPSRTVGLVTNSLGMSAHSIASLSQALSLDDNADISTESGEFTVACWVAPTALAETIILDKTDEYRFGLDGTSKPYFKYGDTDTATWGSAATVNEWILLAGGYNVAEGVWVSVNDGARVKTAQSSAPSDTANALRIFSTSAGGSYFTGAVDACAIWKKDVPIAKITELFASGAGVEHPWSSIASLIPELRWAWLIHSREVYVR